MRARVALAEPLGARPLVEIDGAAESNVDASAIRRFIALELADLEIPPPPGTVEGSVAPLFFRVLGSEGPGLSVELWELGEFWGSRTVELASSDRRLNARRVALGARELARRLLRTRTVEVRLWQQAEEAERQARLTERVNPIGARPTLIASVLGAYIGDGDLILAGPSLGGRLGFGALRIGLNVAWLGGQVDAADEQSTARWFEISLSPAYALSLGARSELEWGATVGSAFAHLAGFAEVDEISGQADTWSARVTTDLYYQWQAGDDWALRAGPSVGALFRAIPVTTYAGSSERLNGLWLGASVSFVVAPSEPAAAADPVTLADYEAEF